MKNTENIKLSQGKPSFSIIVDGLSKNYNKGEVKAVKDVSFSVKKGEMFGLIGPDGAGKTSIFRMLTTLLLPDAGSGSVDGLDLIKDYKKIRNTVGYMPGKFSLYPDLSVEENLEFFATLFNTTIEENYHLIKEIYVQIEPFKKRRAGKLSGGMKQKLALCCALIHKPTVLFLDEPTTGVDPVSRKEFWEMLKSLKQQGITILVSTPYMDEATMCDRIALIQNGRILSINSPEGISNAYPDRLFAVKSNNMYALLKELSGYESTINCYAFGEFAHVVVDCDKEISDEEIAKDIASCLATAGLGDSDVQVVKASIEDCFIGLTFKN